jgi:hypothetical protein
MDPDPGAIDETQLGTEVASPSQFVLTPGCGFFHALKDVTCLSERHRSLDDNVNAVFRNGRSQRLLICYVHLNGTDFILEK